MAYSVLGVSNKDNHTVNTSHGKNKIFFFFNIIEKLRRSSLMISDDGKKLLQPLIYIIQWMVELMKYYLYSIKIIFFYLKLLKKIVFFLSYLLLSRRQH